MSKAIAKKQSTAIKRRTIKTPKITNCQADIPEIYFSGRVKIEDNTVDLLLNHGVGTATTLPDKATTVNVKVPVSKDLIQLVSGITKLAQLFLD
jgi:hypothetical protein